MIITRRTAVLALTALASSASRLALGGGLPRITVTKDPDCGCCVGWVEHLRRHGFAVETVDTPHIDRIKARLSIPKDLWACHTGEGAGYVFEGHVPAPAIVRFLAEKPPAAGLSVPGMPSGSPGMEAEGLHGDPYDVILFGPAGRRTYARFKGAEELPL
jgi:hypothetical protein